MNKPTTVDEYLATVPKVQRHSLQDLREKIIRNIPNVEEKIAFGKPFYYLGNSYVVSFAAAKAHNSFHTMSFDVAKQLNPAINDAWKVDGGSIKFATNHMLDETVVHSVVQLRLKEMVP